MLLGILALILGLVLVLWPDSAINYLVILIGVLFLVPGLIALVGYLTRDKKHHAEAVFPIDGAGSLLLGLWLVIMPTFFVNILMYVLGILLIIGGIQQLVTLNQARKWTQVSSLFYIIPILILLCGILILFKPFQVMETAFILFGITSMIYGISELVNAIRFRKPKNLTT